MFCEKVKLLLDIFKTRKYILRAANGIGRKHLLHHCLSRQDRRCRNCGRDSVLSLRNNPHLRFSSSKNLQKSFSSGVLFGRLCRAAALDESSA